MEWNRELSGKHLSPWHLSQVQQGQIRLGFMCKIFTFPLRPNCVLKFVRTYKPVVKCVLHMLR